MLRYSNKYVQAARSVKVVKAGKYGTESWTKFVEIMSAWMDIQMSHERRKSPLVRLKNPKWDRRNRVYPGRSTMAACPCYRGNVSAILRSSSNLARMMRRTSTCCVHSSSKKDSATKEMLVKFSEERSAVFFMSMPKYLIMAPWGATCGRATVPLDPVRDGFFLDIHKQKQTEQPNHKLYVQKVW